MATPITVKSPGLIYPGAIWKPLMYHSEYGTLDAKNQLTAHITEGTTANGAFATFMASQHPNRTSAHVIIDRDELATVYQILPFTDVAYHASQVNWHSIGIEHVALSQAGADLYNKADAEAIAAGKIKPFTYLPVTEPQYKASAKLMAWLCKQLGFACDRAHIRSHAEASPADHHDLCCSGALDLDRLVAMAAAL